MPFTSVSDFVLDQVFGYQTANYLKNNIVALASARLRASFGGSREASLNGSGALDLFDYRELTFVSTNLSGLTIQARVETKTANAGTSVTPKIRNVTDSTDLVTGSAVTATSFTEEVLSMTPLTSGTKKYKMMVTTNNASNDVWGFGVCETYA